MKSNFVNVMLFVYPLALVAISVIIYSHLPHFTYKDATAIVIQETFEKIDYTKKNKINNEAAYKTGVNNNKRFIASLSISFKNIITS